MRDRVGRRPGGDVVTDKLEALRRDGWTVRLDSDEDGWRLAISRWPIRGSMVYRGPDLDALVRRAWAGEPGDA